MLLSSSTRATEYSRRSGIHTPDNDEEEITAFFIQDTSEESKPTTLSMSRANLSADLQSFLTKMVRDPNGHIKATLLEEGATDLLNIGQLDEATIETMQYSKSGAKFGPSNAEKLQLIMASNYMIEMFLQDKDISDLSIYDANEFQKWSIHYIEKRYRTNWNIFCNVYRQRGIQTEDKLFELLEWMKVQFKIDNKPHKIHECDTVIETEYNTHKHAKITSSPDDDVSVLDMANTDSEDSSHNNRTQKADECDTDIETELYIHEHTTVTKTLSSDDDDISSPADGTPSSNNILSPDDKKHTFEDVQLVDSGKLAFSRELIFEDLTLSDSRCALYVSRARQSAAGQRNWSCHWFFF